MVLTAGRSIEGREMVGVVSSRPICPDDLPFLQSLYATTREEELALVDWSDEQKDAFLQQQFCAQHTFYQEQFADAQFDMILSDGKPVGRLYVDRRADEIRCIDIAVLPAHRGAGIGTTLMNGLLDEGAETGKPVRIHVDKINQAALRLYERLGFQVIEDQQVCLFMEWNNGAKEIAGN